MSYYHVDNGTIIKRLPRSPVKESLYATEAELLAELATRDVFPENVIEPALEDWEKPGARSETWNAAEQRVDVTYAVDTTPLKEYKLSLARKVIDAAIQNPEFSDRELIWAIADYALPVNVLPDAYRDAVLSAEQSIISGIRSKLAAIRSASTHADAKAAFDA